MLPCARGGRVPASQRLMTPQEQLMWAGHRLIYSCRGHYQGGTSFFTDKETQKSQVAKTELELTAGVKDPANFPRPCPLLPSRSERDARVPHSDSVICPTPACHNVARIHEITPPTTRTALGEQTLPSCYHSLAPRRPMR